MSNDLEIGFVGAGQMGEALIRGLLKAAFCPPEMILASDVRSDRLDAMREKYGIQVTPRNTEVAARCGTAVLCVKPQDIAPVLSELSPVVRKDGLILSIAAGVPLDFIEDQLPHGARVIRVMPNTPCLLQMGCSALAFGRYATGSDMVRAKAVFQAVGEVVEVDEALMDAVTGVSGNGPAYVYLFVEALIDAAVSMGLSRQVARTLVHSTVVGAMRMLQESGKHPAELREQVTSPGGTATAALAELERGSFRFLALKAVQAGTLRSKELGRALRS